MSFVTDKALITTVLNEMGYFETAVNIDLVNNPPGNRKNLSYTLKPVGLRTEFNTAFSAIDETRAELVIRYIGMKPADFDKNFDSFNEALTAIKHLHSGYRDDPEYKLDSKNNFDSYGVVNLILGVNQC
jgi:hypothetical protein